MRGEHIAVEGEGRKKGHTKHADDGDEIEIYLASRSLEDFRVHGLHLPGIISAQARDDIRAIFLVRGTGASRL